MENDFLMEYLLNSKKQLKKMIKENPKSESLLFDLKKIEEKITEQKKLVNE